jgi:hypothetical protein
VVLVVEELLDLLPNFLIAGSGSIIIASTFEFRGPADSSFLLEQQHGGRQHPPITAFGNSEGHPARNETEPQSSTVPFDLDSNENLLKSFLNGEKIINIMYNN